ncbi:MAG: DNA methyltransferase, partial [Nitrososphaera sp.]
MAITQLPPIEQNKFSNTGFRQFFSKAGKLTHLHNMDCLDGLSLYPNNYFDIVVTSPPYNLGISYGQYNDSISRTNYLAWLEQVVMKIKEKIKNEGSFFLNMGASPTNPWGPFEVAMMLRSHFQLQNIIHWIKSIYIENESYGKKVEINVGHYKPINGRRFLNDGHEYIFHFTKTGNVQLDRLSIGVPYKDVGNI